MYIGEGGVTEPMWVYLSFGRRAYHRGYFVEHPIGAREITALTLTTPVPLRSAVSRVVVERGILATRAGAESLLEIEFDRSHQKESADLRPRLPVILHF